MNPEPRLQDDVLGDDTALPSDGPSAETGEQPGARGFFGRFFDALTGGDDDGTATGGEGAAAQPAPGMLNLRRLRVDDVAIPKVEIIAAPLSIKLEDLVEMFREHGFSRLPVFRGTLDSPQGMIHLKDLALKHGFGQGGKFTLRPMLRPLLYVPPSMPIGVLLQQMQQKRTHMALVIDEYGGVDGLVTIEDLIEQVIGQIEDEHDEDEGGLWVSDKPGQWLIQARAPLNEVEAETGLRLTGGDDEDEVDTLGGLIFMLAGRVPLRGEVITHDSGAEFDIVEADPRRIKRVRLRLPGVSPAPVPVSPVPQAAPRGEGGAEGG